MLTLLWVLPAAGAVAAAVTGRRGAWLAPAAAAAAFLLNLALWTQAGQLGTTVAWFGGAYGSSVQYSLGLSGLSLVLVALTLLVTAIAGTAGLRLGSGFVAWMGALGAAAVGMFLARDLILFYVFWELTLIPAYFLLIGWGGTGRVHAAWKFLLYNVGGSVALLLGIAALAAFGVHMPGLGVNAGATGGSVPAAAAAPICLLLFIGFAVKTPLWPLQGWVGDTYAELPAPAAALVGAVQSKAGLYGMLALLLPLLRSGLAPLAPYFIAAAVISVLYGAFCALTARDARRLLAYSSVSHLGLIMVAFLTLDGGAIAGGIIQMIAHGVFVAALFLLVGMLETRLGGPVELARLGGLARRAPAVAGALILLAMAALGLPGLAGFPGELLMVVGIYHYSGILAILAGLGLIVAAAYMLRLIQLVLHGPLPADPAVADLHGRERWLLAPLAALCLVIGIFPQAIVGHQSAPAVAALVATASAQGGNG